MIEVNGIEKGKGSGPSKQLAKEEAARAAYFAMGWAPRTSDYLYIHMRYFVLTRSNTRRMMLTI